MADIAKLLDVILAEGREADKQEERRQRARRRRRDVAKIQRNFDRRPDDLRRSLSGRYVAEAMADAEN